MIRYFLRKANYSADRRAIPRPTTTQHHAPMDLGVLDLERDEFTFEGTKTIDDFNECLGRLAETK